MSVKFTAIELAILQWLKNNSSQLGKGKSFSDFHKEATSEIPCELEAFVQVINNLTKEGYVLAYHTVGGGYYATQKMFIDITEKGLVALRELEG